MKAVTEQEPVSMDSLHQMATGSIQQSLWGINLYPDLPQKDWLEFDSMINLRPSSGNRSRNVDDPSVRERIRDLVDQLVLR